MNLKSVLLLVFIGYGAHVAATEDAGVDCGPSNGLSFVGQTWASDPKPSPVMIRVKKGDEIVALLIGSEHTVPLINLDTTFLFDMVRLHKEKGIKFFFEIADEEDEEGIVADPSIWIREVLTKIRAAFEAQPSVEKDRFLESSEEAIDAMDRLVTVKIDDIDVPASLVRKWGLSQSMFKKIGAMFKEYPPVVIEPLVTALTDAELGRMNKYNLMIGLDETVRACLRFWDIPTFGLETQETREENGFSDIVPMVTWKTEDVFCALHKISPSLCQWAFTKYDLPYKRLWENVGSPSETTLDKTCDESRIPRNKQMVQVFLRTLENHLEGRSPMPIGEVGSAHFLGPAGLLPSIVRWVEEKSLSLTVEIKDTYGEWLPAPRETFADPAQGMPVAEFEVWKSMQPTEDGAVPSRRGASEPSIEFSRPYVSQALQTLALGNVTFAFIKRDLDDLSSKEARMLQAHDIVYMRTPQYLHQLRKASTVYLEGANANPPVINGYYPRWGLFAAHEPYVGMSTNDYSREYFKKIGEKYTLASYFFLDTTDPILDVVTHNVDLTFRLAFAGTTQEVRSLPFENVSREVKAREAAARHAARHPLWEQVEKRYDYTQPLSTSIASLFVPDAETRKDRYLPIHAQGHVGRITSVPKEFYFPELEDLYRALVPDLPIVEEGKRALVLLPAFLLPYAQQKYLQPPSYRLHEWAF